MRKKMTQGIKHMLNAMAHAHAGDHLNRKQKHRVFAATLAHSTHAESRPQTPSQPQVGLYVGSELAAEVMQYAMQTAGRLRHGLTVLTSQPEEKAQALLSPYHAELTAAGIEVRVVPLTGDPVSALAHALRRRPEVAFLVCNETGYFGHGLLNRANRNGGIPIPVVLVASADAPASQDVQEEPVKIERTA